MKEKNYLLNIHTTGETALVALANGAGILGTAFNPEFKQHATFLHVAIRDLLKESNLIPGALKAISVTHGPGSYTGIRVGLSAAKGLCYALKIPLITLNTLDVLAASAIHKLNDPLCLYFPMIDARRMEVYTAMYNFNLSRLFEPQAAIVDSTFFEKYIQSGNTYFFGSGSFKFEKLIEEKQNRSNYIFKNIEIDPEAMAMLSNLKFTNHQFSDLAYSEPEYLKEFKSTAIK